MSAIGMSAFRIAAVPKDSNDENPFALYLAYRVSDGKTAVLPRMHLADVGVVRVLGLPFARTHIKVPLHEVVRDGKPKKAIRSDTEYLCSLLVCLSGWRTSVLCCPSSV